MKRRLGHCLMIGLLAAIVLFFPLLASPHRIDEAHRSLIRRGMTAAEVESIFGVPAGTYDWAVVEKSAARVRYYRVLIAHMERQLASERSAQIPLVAAADAPRKRRAVSEQFQSWTSRRGSVTIGFDEDGLVSWISGWHKVRVEPPWKKWWERIHGN